MKMTQIALIDPRTLSDGDLLNYSLLYGKLTLRARNKFIGSLPEVARRGLYSKNGFESVFHYAKITGGVSEEQVRNALNLGRQFENMPNLSRLLAMGIVSVNKLIRITSVVKSENEEFWANQVQLLSKSALEVLVRDYKNAQKTENNNDTVTTLFDESEDDTQKIPLQSQALNPSSELPGQLVKTSKNEGVKSVHIAMANELHLDADVRDELVSMQQKGIDINSELRELLMSRKQYIESEKERLGKEQDEKALRGENTRYIPVEIRKLLKKEYGDRCSLPGCKNKAVEINHTNVFSMAKSHNPKYLAPMCDPHHKIAHAVDVKVAEMRNRGRT